MPILPPAILLDAMKRDAVVDALSTIADIHTSAANVRVASVGEPIALRHIAKFCFFLFFRN